MMWDLDVRRLPRNLRWAFSCVTHAADRGCLCLMTTGRSEWVGDFFINKQTALALQRRGLVTIDWGESQLDDVPEIRPTGCHAHKDGECFWDYCPQVRDDEPAFSGRHCPLDISEERS